MFAGKAEFEDVIEQDPATRRRPSAARDAGNTCPARIGLGHVPSILHGYVVQRDKTGSISYLYHQCESCVSKPAA